LALQPPFRPYAQNYAPFYLAGAVQSGEHRLGLRMDIAFSSLRSRHGRQDMRVCTGPSPRPNGSGKCGGTCRAAPVRPGCMPCYVASSELTSRRGDSCGCRENPAAGVAGSPHFEQRERARRERNAAACIVGLPEQHMQGAATHVGPAQPEALLGAESAVEQYRSNVAQQVGVLRLERSLAAEGRASRERRGDTLLPGFRRPLQWL